jgi:hypothetical protein
VREVVGIDRRIKRVWLDALLDRLSETADEAELRRFLDERLERELPGAESRAKTIGILLRVWSGIPSERQSLRERAVAMLAEIPGPERIWLHWGMATLAYPFFRDGAEIVGRTLFLQDDFTTAHVQARMLTAWGDRVTTKRATQKLITTFVDWNVLRSTRTKGHFQRATKMTTGSVRLQLWLIEALLVASEPNEVEAQQLLRLPESFPFAITARVGDLRAHEAFDIHRQGLDMDIVGLHRVPLEQPAVLAKRQRDRDTTAQAGLFDGPVDKPALVEHSETPGLKAALPSETKPFPR